MGWLLIIAWVLSPLVLIPVAVVNSNKAKKYKTFIDELRKQGRISYTESQNCFPDPGGRALNYPGTDAPKPGEDRYAQKSPQPARSQGALNYPGLYAQDNANTSVQSPAAGTAPVQGQAFAQNIQQPIQTSAPAQEQKVGVDLLKPEDRAKKTAEQNAAVRAAAAQTNAEQAAPAQSQNTEYTQPKSAAVMQQNELMKQRIAQQKQFAAQQNMQPNAQNFQNGAQPRWVQAPQQMQQPPRPKRPKIELNSTTVLFGIGSIFMILTGIIFSTAYWVDIGYWARVGVLVFEAIVFFAMYFFMNKKLKMGSTASVMYLLGSVFTVISYLTTGYFGLFGSWFGFESKGTMAFLALGSLIITFFSGRALRLFKKPFCEYTACLSMALSGTLLLGQFSTYFENKFAAFGMFITLAGTGATAAYYYLKNKGTEISRSIRLCHILVRIIFTVMTVPILLYDLFSVNGASVFGWIICVIYTGELIWHAVRTGSEKWLYAQAALLLAGIISLGIALDELSIFALITTVFAAASGWAYLYLGHKDKLLVKADHVHVIMRAIFACITFAALFFGLDHGYNAANMITAVIFIIDFAALAAYYKKQLLLIPQCICFLITVFEICRKTDSEAYTLIILTAIGMTGTAAYTFLKKYKKKDLLRVNADVVCVFVRVIMGLPVAVYLADRYEHWDAVHWSVCAAFIIELTVYSIINRRRRELSFQNIFLFAALGQIFVHTESSDKFLLFSWMFYAAATAAYTLIKKKGKLLFNADYTIIAVRSIVTAMTVGFFIEGYPKWTTEMWLICSLIAVEMLIYGLILKSQIFIGIHAVFLSGILFEIYFLLGDYSQFALIALAFTTIGTAVYYHLRKADKLLFNADMVLAGMRSLFGVVCLITVTMDGFKWSPVGLTVMAVFAAELLYYGIHEKKEILIGAHAVMLTGVLMELGLLLDSYRYFALFCCIVAAAGTFVYTYLAAKEKLSFRTTNVLIAVRAVYGLICAGALASEWLGWSWQALVITAVTAAELTYYGLRMKNRILMRAQSFALMALCGISAYKLSTVIPGYYTGMFIFALLVAACLVIYHICGSIYTKTADGLFMAVLFGMGCGLMYDAAIPYGVIIMAFFMAFTVLDAFSSRSFLAKGMQILMPVPAMLTASMLANFLRREYSMRCMPVAMSVCAAVLCAAAFMTGFGRRESRKFTIMKYSLEIGSGLSILTLMISRRGNITAGIIALLVSVLLFSVIQSSKVNMHSLMPMLGIFLGVYTAARGIWVDPMRSGNAMIIFSIVMTALLTVVSKLKFPDNLTIHNDMGKYHWDVPHLGILICIISCATKSMMFSGRARLFIAILEMTAFAANFYRRNNTPALNRKIFTAATALAALALVLRPFMVFKNATVTTKIILVIIVLFGLAVKRIWRDEKKVASEFSQAVFMAAFILLIIDGLVNQSLANLLIVLCASLTLLICSFVIKSRRWFLISAATLLLLTLYTTGDFLATIAWWVYLLIAGLILIIVAAVTEYNKQKGNKNEARFFVDWKW